jgi:hypothetical protein
MQCMSMGRSLCWRLINSCLPLWHCFLPFEFLRSRIGGKYKQQQVFIYSFSKLSCYTEDCVRLTPCLCGPRPNTTAPNGVIHKQQAGVSFRGLLLWYNLGIISNRYRIVYFLV